MEFDELYWFIGHKGKSKTRENVYLLIMVNRSPRHIVGFDVAWDKSPERIQSMVDNAPSSEMYFSDGYLGYIDVVYSGKYKRNVRDKSDTFTVESINSDLRHYIPLLARRSKCFARKLETLYAVLKVFICAYNRFGSEKIKYRKHMKSGEFPFSVLDFL